jgi:predicted nucleic-acid-binding protein
MKAIDTNILVRFLVNDDPAQAQQVRQLFSAAEQQRETYFVPLLVVLESIWVLESAYQVGRNELIEVFSDLLLLPVLEFEQREAVQAMLQTARNDPLDLPDLLIAKSALRSGCECIFTFDKKAARSDAFELLAS